MLGTIGVMRKPLIVVSAVALVIGLAGCTNGAEIIEPEPAPVETEETTEVEAAPLEAAPKAAEPDSPEAAYLELIRQYSDRGPEIADATDEQLLAAGKLACEQFAEGKTHDEIRVVDGEEPDQLGGYPVSSAISGTANQFLCTP